MLEMQREIIAESAPFGKVLEAMQQASKQEKKSYPNGVPSVNKLQGILTMKNKTGSLSFKNQNLKAVKLATSKFSNERKDIPPSSW